MSHPRPPPVPNHFQSNSQSINHPNIGVQTTSSSPSTSPVITPTNRSNSQSINGSPVMSVNHSSMERSTPFNQSNHQSNHQSNNISQNASNRPSLVFEGDSLDGSYSFVISAPNSGPASPNNQRQTPPEIPSNIPASTSSSLDTMNQMNAALPHPPSPNPKTPPALLSQAVTSTAPTQSPSQSSMHSSTQPISQSSSHSTSHTTNQSLDDVKTIEFYLKQAISAKDAEALTSLLGKHRLLNQSTNPSINQSLVHSANLIIAEKRAENLHTSIFYLRQAIDTKNRDAIKMLLGKIDGSFLNETNNQSNHISPEDMVVVDEARRVLSNLDKENVQTVHFYLKQGLQLKNRDLIKQSLEKVVDLPADQLDSDLVHTARQALGELDQQHLIKYYLNSAIKQRNAEGLESALEEAKKYKMGSDITEVNAATRLLVELRNRKQKKSKSSKPSKPSTLTSSSSSTVSRLFGGPLLEAVRRSEQPIPRICHECMDWLSQHSLDEPGLFRVAGEKKNVESLKLAYESQFVDGRLVELNDPHDTASVLKLYLRSLPDPLIPYDRYDTFLRCAQSLKDKPLESRIEELRPLVDTLPVENYALFSSLCRFLSMASSHPLNKMTVDNLAIVWAPNLMRPATETQNTMLYDTPITIHLLATFITHCQAIFTSQIQHAAQIQSINQSVNQYSHSTMPQPQSSYNSTSNTTMQRKFANSQTL